MARVLIIDDSPTTAFFVGEALRLQGHEIEMLEQFGALSDRLDRFVPELIVLDLMMPGFNGIQFAAFIQRYADSVPPIVLYSGCDRELVRAAARQIRPAEIVSKATDMSVLCEAVARALGPERRSKIA